MADLNQALIYCNQSIDRQDHDPVPYCYALSLGQRIHTMLNQQDEGNHITAKPNRSNPNDRGTTIHCCLLVRCS
jgi:hypothetical protein